MNKIDSRVVYAAASSRCNNNCVFCTDFSGAAKAARRNSAEVKELRGPADGYRIVFTAAEPTLNKNLFTLIAQAAALGYRGISVITNGRMLAYPAYCARLLVSGVSEIIVSLHGATAGVHDRITGVRGSGEQTMAGLSNLLRLRPAAPAVNICVNTTINAINLPELPKLKRYLLSLDGIKNIVFHGLRPAGRALKNWNSLAVSYSRAVESLSRGSGRWPANLRLWDVPLCVAAMRVPRGSCEFARPNTAIISRAGKNVDVLSGKRIIGCCSACSGLSLCGGVYERYLKTYGEGEFHALR